MEVTGLNMEDPINEKYARARKKVDAIKGFHRHIAVFVVINLAVLLLKANILSVMRPDRINLQFERWLDWNTWGTVFFWGIALIIHGCYVYRFNFKFIRRWEERKLMEFMENDDWDNNKTRT